MPGLFWNPRDVFLYAHAHYREWVTARHEGVTQSARMWFFAPGFPAVARPWRACFLSGKHRNGRERRTGHEGYHG